MPGFSEDSAKRIARSVRYTERLQGVPSTDPNENYGAASGNQICLVQTGPTLPTGYTGAMGAPGQVIEKQSNGTINKLGAIWIKDINGGTLSASTIYQARIGGTWTQDVTTNGIVKPTTLGLYLVQKSGGGGIYEPFKVTNITTAGITVMTLDTLKTGLAKLAVPTFVYLGAQAPAMFSIIRPTIYGSGIWPSSGQDLTIYKIDPFTFWAEARYYTSTSYGDIVTCRAPGYIGNANPWNFDANDPLRLVRRYQNNYGYCQVVLQAFPNFTCGASNNFGVISANGFDTLYSGIGSGIGSGISGV
jgi:hypothetical protein